MAVVPVRGVRTVAGRAARRVVPRVLRGPLRFVLRQVVGRWRRSVQLRVVSTTVVLGLVVVLVVGQSLLQRIVATIVDGRVATVKSQALADIARTEDSFRLETRETDGGPNGPDEQARFAVAQLAGNSVPPLRYVILRHSIQDQGRPSQVQERSSVGVSREIVPDELRQAVNRAPGDAQVKIFTARLDDHTGPVVAVGKLIDLGAISGGRFELYLVYSLSNEVEVIDGIRRSFIVGGVVLVLLVGAVAWVVTRQVVAPVRQAARTAEQLASGRLDRRMRVRGEDELARLGRAFNEMAASLERQIHQLEELSRVQRRFVSDVSHELRTPLTTLRMAGEVMYEARHSFEPALGRSAELLQAQLDRFESLLADLLEVSRFDAGAALLETEAVDLCEIVDRVVDDLRPLAQRHATQVDVRSGPGTTVAEVDPRRVERIVRNLLGNALEHSESRPVQVRITGDADAVAIGVRDHGVGLRPADLGSVFNRFWRADPARARTTGGTGLGLAIALEDAHLHGGWLQVWGEPGEGA
ncbi:MAG TPA: MtrAB system histidine kinase MtrB, partial [Kineosporiaceae bacterium]|nr:MtrAB system histidine kinase MtrB [Kineosporiaceae bacterium]